MSDRHDTTGPAMDDERLLAVALGLEDEPAATVAGEDGDVAARLARARGDIDEIVGRLRTTIPDPPDGYAEPSSARWVRLHEYFAAPVPGRPVRVHHGRGRLVATLAAAAVLALVVGIGIVGLGGNAGDTAMAPSSGDAGAEMAGVPTTDKAGSGDLAAASIVLPEAEHFRAVVVARAGEVVDDVQRFTVVRTLKGRVTGTLALLLHEGAAALPTGSLEILYLHPLRDYVMAADGAGPDDTRGADTSTAPVPSTTSWPQTPAAEAGMPAPAAGYSLAASDAYVQAVPADVDVTLLSVR